MVRDRRRKRTCVALPLRIARRQHDTSRASSGTFFRDRLLFCRSANSIGVARK
nr:unnamed protein product [Callosobruchus chinensis]CAH7739198.1 unnamed protein product [Callosobruchus chinensis]